MKNSRMVTRSVVALGVSGVAVTGMATGAVAVGHHPAAASASAQICTRHAGDADLARKVSGHFHGARLGDSVDAQQIACARAIVAGTKSIGLPRRAAYIALMTAIAESTLHNHKGGADDSVGLFQQRPSQGWGSVAQCRTPEHATRTFLRHMLADYPHGGWRHTDAAKVAQRVQISAYPSAYTGESSPAKVLVDAIWSGRTPPPSTPPAPPKKHRPTKVYKNVWAQASSYTKPSGGRKVGVLHTGRNYFFCQAKGSEVHYDGYRNGWWLKTDDDSGNANVWVNATHVSGGANDARIPGVPTC
ncbi:hypothetical protein [Allobranchiibius sp. CTAmp26]|uniref:hypothetical protein n=1 Tax=Allobranchiibius sp. CTAmp26 TaxID=2815214 RepID=UPI001AA137F0|nr:hypothetical protein [Allobranchiibius sp. CTAmp26]MBO1756133.1 hypothetical protein [Allobranchiibius sp. CTAmp26]